MIYLPQSLSRAQIKPDHHGDSPESFQTQVIKQLYSFTPYI